ncbi:hypothetical protein PG993_010860 [Apiospora rasikravindrae]|uniref:Uncharacterized protein n=1 Tax=Apiospora rasikravindrae TaxID=990691 RepID=A0ABR1SCK8_9PEZI
MGQHPFRPVICHEARYLPRAAEVCHAPGPNTLLTVGFDRRIHSEAFQPNIGGNFNCRIQYTGTDSHLHKAQSKSNHHTIPDDWFGLLGFDFDVPHYTIKHDPAVTIP